ncbi:adenylate kinase isoenzyme 6 [Tetranychus urticae]|uniref:Adenylate kinase isoenzyme 6 homolog n=1 Tax=Tetranychus urticae TaxID=32264 RepID=T1JX35_TETUR|nr:adenylate kinase isoenzyme 6 [Tetranychus urticae]
MANMRRYANILITGTPGTGKTSICEKLLSSLHNYQYINVGEFAAERQLYIEYDHQLECHVLDEDAVVEQMRPIMEDDQGGIIVDFHGCDLFPEEWFDQVFVLRTSNTPLFDRLSDRGYSQKKLDTNVESEIFQVILDEAKQTFDEDIIVELNNDEPADLDANVNHILDYIECRNNRHYDGLR